MSQEMTYVLAKDLIEHITKEKSGSRFSHSPVNHHHAETLRREVCKKMFSDEHVNWGRVVTIFAFAAACAQRVVVVDKNINMNVKRTIIEVLTAFVNETLQCWITDQPGGWDAMIIFSEIRRKNEGMSE
ncbi:hypothetical protein CAPTEDRAFT_187496 [Capitella teleta]|uniref:Bcl-2 Bcl-2 homology region 1-3 domain-containing protein n=1 Tax=Capitella teleta TaxID=283909 RepID=R7TNP5_CAPTE|nr:hypothetical protein CAPTEDRAFT_187496 [Capitella teleta]|eukprot:ELT95167.1 hypothetical protein CAPTEDRAFT_187496 [Capitella teleta]